MKLFAIVACVTAVPQRHLAPGMRDRESDGSPKFFLEDMGYPAQTRYDFEANRNPNAKPANPLQTSMLLNLICRGTPTDDLCKNGLQGPTGKFPEFVAGLYDIGKEANDVKTPFDDPFKPLIAEAADFTTDELKTIWFHNLLRKESDNPDSPLLKPPMQSLFGTAPKPTQLLTRPLHLGGHQTTPILSHFMWTKICDKNADNTICKARNTIKQQYVDYVNNLKTVFAKTQG